MARRIGSAKARYITFSSTLEYLTIWLNINVTTKKAPYFLGNMTPFKRQLKIFMKY